LLNFTSCFYFQLPVTGINKTEAGSQKVERIDIDINSLSTKAQWKLLKQESPELKELITDFKVHYQFDN